VTRRGLPGQPGRAHATGVTRSHSVNNWKILWVEYLMNGIYYVAGNAAIGGEMIFYRPGI
jgi:hypothetical protein